MQFTTMLDKEHVMFNVIQNILMIFGDSFFCTRDWVWNVDKYCQLKIVPMHLLYFNEINEGIILTKSRTYIIMLGAKV
jgi:hypothetical protein